MNELKDLTQLCALNLYSSQDYCSIWEFIYNVPSSLRALGVRNFWGYKDAKIASHLKRCPNLSALELTIDPSRIEEPDMMRFLTDTIPPLEKYIARSKICYICINVINTPEEYPLLDSICRLMSKIDESPVPELDPERHFQLPQEY